MKSGIYLLFLFLLFTLSCDSEKSTSEKASKGPISYEIDLGASSVGFLDQIESISIFGFEETEASLLKPSSFFFDYEDGVIVVHEGSGTVYLFDKAGNYVSQFSRKGDGPEEYGTMQNTVYRNGFIETYDISKQRLSRYDLSGKFLSALKLPVRATHVFYHEGRYLMSMGNKKGVDSLNYNLAFIDETGKELGRAMQIDLAVPFPIATSINEFTIVDSKPVFNAFLTDSIVVIDNLEPKQFMKFDFGSDWFWTEDMYANGYKAMDLIDDANKVWIYNGVIGNDRVEISYNTSFTDYRQGFINRSNGEFLHYDYSSWKEEIPSIRRVRFEGDVLVITILSDVLEVFIEKLGREKYTIESRQSLEALLSSENPLIVKIKFKP